MDFGDLALTTSGPTNPQATHRIATLKHHPEAHLILSVTISNGGVVPFETFAMVDSGATSNFINSSFVTSRLFRTIKKPVPRPLEVVDGRPIEGGDVVSETHCQLGIGDHLAEACRLRALMHV